MFKKKIMSATWLNLVILSILGIRLMPSALADEQATARFYVERLSFEQNSDQLFIDGKIHYAFNNAVIDAIEHGVPVTIRLQVRLIKIRRWWLDKTLAENDYFYTIKYHALGQQYLLSRSGERGQIVFTNLRSLLAFVGDIHQLCVADMKVIDPDSSYQAAVRAHIDIEALPPALRPRAYISSDWDLDTDWYRWFLQN